MRIGVVTTSYPRHDGDAAGSFVAAHVAAMRALGHDVDVIGAHELRSRLFDAAGAPEELERGRGYVDAALFTLRLARDVRRRLRDCELIVAHWLVPSALAALAAQRPVLAIAHGGDVHLLRRLHLLGPVLRLLRRNVRLAFVSNELYEVARRAVPDLEAIVQPMGIDTAHFATLSRATTSPPTILVVARLVPIKGVDVMLAARSHLRTRARLVIAGDGPECFDAPDVTFLGAVDARTRDQLLCQASVVVVPSRVLPNGRTEGMPMIALEALAAGVPVVASAVGGLRSLVAATQVPPDDPRALAAAIDRVLAFPPASDELRRGVAAFAWQRVAAKLLACEAGDTSRRRSA